MTCMHSLFVDTYSSYRSSIIPSLHYATVVKGDPHDGQLADCYALGATIYCIKFGRPPFIGQGGLKNKRLMDMYDQITHSPLTFPGPIDSGLRDMISKLMIKDPMQRMRLAIALKHPWLSNQR